MWALAAGVTIDQARSEMRGIAHRLSGETDARRNRGVEIVPLKTTLRGADDAVVEQAYEPGPSRLQNDVIVRGGSTSVPEASGAVGMLGAVPSRQAGPAHASLVP